MKKVKIYVMLFLSVLLAACSNAAENTESGITAAEATGIKPVYYYCAENKHPGILLAETEKAAIDYSNTNDGYVMMRMSIDSGKRFKARVEGPDTTYTYNLVYGVWTAMPLSDGNGEYTFTVFENIEDNKYATVLSAQHEVELSDEFAPFLRPNQYVNYADAPETVKMSGELTKGMNDPMDKVTAIYDYVTSDISYDKKLADSVQSGYLPDLDRVLAAGKGICFDYASLMTAMLRCQNVPCKLVVGYVKDMCHAWISVWTEETGWIDAISFDGNSWNRLDPTFAATLNKKTMAGYIGDGNNYSDKYYY